MTNSNLSTRKVLGGLALGGAALATLDYLYHKRDIPGPPELPLLGNTLEVDRNYDRLLDWFTEMTERYGHTWTFRIIGQPRFVCITDPACCEHILKTNFDNFIKGPEFHARFVEVLGNGIFNVDGESWRIQRKTASHIFNVRNFKDNMVVVFNNHADFLVDHLLNLPKGDSIDIANYFFRFTLDSVGEIAFGKNINSLREDVPFANAFDGAQYTSQLRFLALFWRFRKSISPLERKLTENVKVMNQFAYDLIKERRAEKNISKRSDLLSLFLSGTDTECTDDYLRDVIMSFIIAARDTTAQCLGWCVHMLNEHPDVEEKLIEELDSVIGDETPTYEHTKKLKYMHCFISEVLRLYPSVPKDAKMAVNDDVLPDGTKVKSGDWVVYLPWVMGRLESIWGPDAKEFKPERWLPEDFKPSPFKFVTFQAGPRTCLGQNMAYLEAKMVLAKLYQKMRLRVVPGHVVTYENSVTLPTRYGIQVTVEPRRK